MKSSYLTALLFFVLIMVLASLPWGGLSRRLRVNLAGLQAMAILQDADHSALPLALLDSPYYQGLCDVDWFNSLIAQQNFDLPKRDEYWDRVTDCAPELFSFAYLYAKNDPYWARRAINDIPQYASSWFWAAGLAADDQKGFAIAAYRTGLELNPLDAHRWRLLGDLLAEEAPDEALEAYRRSCCEGDPGNHGCLNAGLTAEKLGDYRRAIRFYNYSDQDFIIARGQKLEETFGIEANAWIFKFVCP